MERQVSAGKEKRARHEMKYGFDSRIRFSEVDEDGFLRFENFINYFQDCSTFQSEDLGVGVKYLKERDLVWVVSSWQIELIKYPKLCDKITIGTFAYDFKSFLGYRNFYMTDENGDYLAKASSIWVLLKISTGKPAKVADEQIASYGREERLDMEYKPRKISVAKELKALPEIEVKAHHLDTNHHVNNGQYVCMACGCLAGDIRPKSIRAEYKKQARLNDIIYPYADSNTVDLRSKDGSSYCVVEVEF